MSAANCCTDSGSAAPGGGVLAGSGPSVLDVNFDIPGGAPQFPDSLRVCLRMTTTRDWRVVAALLTGAAALSTVACPLWALVPLMLAELALSSKPVLSQLRHPSDVRSLAGRCLPGACVFGAALWLDSRRACLAGVLVCMICEVWLDIRPKSFELHQVRRLFASVIPLLTTAAVVIGLIAAVPFAVRVCGCFAVLTLSLPISLFISGPWKNIDATIGLCHAVGLWPGSAVRIAAWSVALWIPYPLAMQIVWYLAAAGLLIVVFDRVDQALSSALKELRAANGLILGHVWAEPSIWPRHLTRSACGRPIRSLYDKALAGNVPHDLWVITNARSFQTLDWEREYDHRILDAGRKCPRVFALFPVESLCRSHVADLRMLVPEVRELVLLYQWLQEAASTGKSYAPQIGSYLGGGGGAGRMPAIFAEFARIVDCVTGPARDRLAAEERARTEAVFRVYADQARDRAAALADVEQSRRHLAAERDALTGVLSRLHALPREAFRAQCEAVHHWLKRVCDLTDSADFRRRLIEDSTPEGSEPLPLAAHLREAIDDYFRETVTPVGLRADHQLVTIRRNGGSRADAILVFLETLNRVSAESPTLAGLWKSMTPDGRVYLWLHSAGGKWQSVVMEIDFEAALSGDDMLMHVTTFIPFGLDGDRSSYIAERCSEYTRATHAIHVTVRYVAKNALRSSALTEEVEEDSTGSSASTEHLDRSGVLRRYGSMVRDAARSGSSRRWVDESPLPAGVLGPRTTVEYARSNDRVLEIQSDDHRSSSADTSNTERRFTDRTVRDRSARTNEQTTELLRELTFTSVGIEYSDPDRLLKAWESNPLNQAGSRVRGYVQKNFQTLGDAISRGIAARKLAARGRPGVQPPPGVLGDAFWDEAARLVIVERAGDRPLRVPMPFDGRILPIDEAAVDERRLFGSAQLPPSPARQRLPPATR